MVPHGPDAIETWSSNLCCCCPFFSGPRVGGSVWTRKQHTNEFLQLPHGAYGAQSMTCSADGLDVSGSGFLDCVRKRPNSQKRSFRKVETKDLAGKWCECYGWGWYPGLFCSTKKALNEDQYEESGELGCCVCLPICCCNDSNIRTRQYVNGHPTNGFDEWYRQSYRDPSNTAWGNPMTCRIGKKIG